MAQELLKVNRYRAVIDEVAKKIYVARIKLVDGKVVVNIDSPTAVHPYRLLHHLNGYDDYVGGTYVVIEPNGYSYLDHRFKRIQEIDRAIRHYELVRKMASGVELGADTPTEIKPPSQDIFRAGYDANSREFGVYQLQSDNLEPTFFQTARRICCFGDDTENFAANLVNYVKTPKLKMVIFRQIEEKKFIADLPFTLEELSRIKIAKRDLHDQLIKFLD